MNITFDVSGIPKGQPRPRAFARAGKVRLYDNGNAEAWKGAIALAARPHRPEKPFEGPVYLEIHHVMPRPKAHFGTGKNAAQLRPDVPERHTCKPDLDNLLKAAQDALTQIGIWRDDDQVAECFVTKSYGDFPGAKIVIRDLDL